MKETAYKLHFRTDFQGIPISVENRKGSYRSGTDRDGNEWRQKMDYHYGRIPRTRGADMDQVDVFIGPEKTSERVFIIEQVWPDTGKFDEHKVMLGFLTKAEAIRGYKSQYNRPGFYGGCKTMTISEFKEWLKEQSPRKVERRNLENRVITGQRVIDMKIIQNDEENLRYNDSDYIDAAKKIKTALQSKGWKVTHFKPWGSHMGISIYMDIEKEGMRSSVRVSNHAVGPGRWFDHIHADKDPKDIQRVVREAEERLSRFKKRKKKEEEAIRMKKLEEKKKAEKRKIEYEKRAPQREESNRQKAESEKRLQLYNTPEKLKSAYKSGKVTKNQVPKIAAKIAPSARMTISAIKNFVLEDNMKIVQQDKESKFDKLVKKLMKENGYSEDRARRIAYSIGVKKYGKAGMAAKSAAGRKDAAFITDEDIEEVSAMEDEYLGWEKLVKKLRSEGKSKESAENIAASIGRKKYGKAGMAKKAAAGRDSELTETLQEEGTHVGKDYSQYSPKELALGILVEKEHADDIMDRLEIAADHLEERENYYTAPDAFFIKELKEEYGENIKSAYQGALSLVKKVLSQKPVEDAPNANTVILEAAITPVIKKIMQALGFKKLFWRGMGWIVPIALEEYGNYIKMVLKLKMYDAMLKKFGYEISMKPGFFMIMPVERG